MLAEALNPKVFELLAVHAVVPVLVVGGSCQNELLKLVPEMPQVWSQTQFYSVDFSLLGIGVKSAFSINAQSRFASAVFDCVLGPSSIARHT